MAKTQQQEAVDDLLATWQTPQHELKAGRQLAPALLGDAWKDLDDDRRLLIAIKDLLHTEIARWRQTLELPPAAPNASADLQWLRGQEGKPHRMLLALTLTWACYIEQQKPGDLAHKLSWSTRTIQLKIQEGRAAIAQAIALKQLPSTRSGAQTQEITQQPHPVTAAPDTGPTAASSSRPGTPPIVYQPVDQSLRSQIYGQDVQAVIGTVYGTVKQEKIYHHHHGDSSKQSSPSQGDAAPFVVGVAAVIAAGYWLIQTAPWLSIGSVIVITIWRAIHHGLRLRQLVAWESSSDEQRWQAGYAAAWLGAVVWSIGLALRIPFIFATPEFSFEQFLLVFAFVSVCLYCFWLLNVDLLLWINEIDSDKIPWRWLRSHAQWLWQQRWLTLGITWLLLIMFLFSLAMLVYISP